MDSILAHVSLPSVEDRDRSESSGRDVLQLGLIGAGATGQLRARALRRLPQARLVAVADQNQELAKAVAAEHPGVRVVREPESLAKDSAIDGVIISTPPVSHETLGLKCLRAGKHVLCEKPLAISVTACQRLVDAALDAGLVLATGFTLRQTPAARLARRLVDSGAIGTLDHVRAFHGHSGAEYFGPSWTLDSAITGGGTLMDGGIHMIDLLRWFLGDAQTVVGFATGHVWRMPGCEDNGFLLIQNADGRIGQLHSSWTEWRGYRYRVELYGEEGYVRFGYSPLWLVHARAKPGERPKIQRHFFPRYQILERLRGWRWSVEETLVRDTADWLHAISTESEAPASGRDGLEAVRIAQSVERAS